MQRRTITRAIVLAGQSPATASNTTAAAGIGTVLVCTAVPPIARAIVVYRTSMLTKPLLYGPLHLSRHGLIALIFP